MPTLTDLPVYAGKNWKLHAHPYGNNVAFECAKCGHPVVATTVGNLAGANESHPTTCEGKNCGAQYFLEVIPKKKALIHAL